MPYVDIQGNGPPLVFLHCVGVNGACWLPLVNTLKETYTCYVIDLPGMGWSNNTIPGDLKSITDLVSAVIPDQSYIVGWSFGGQVAMQLALSYPQRVNRVMVIGTTPSAMTNEEDTAISNIRYFIDRLAVDYHNTVLWYLALLTQGHRGSYSTIKRNFECITDRPIPTSVQLYNQLDISLRVDLRDLLSNIHKPVLVMYGDNDTINNVSMYRYMANILPQSIEYVIRGGSHAPFLSHPEIVVQISQHFFSDENNHKGPKICVTI